MSDIILRRNRGVIRWGFREHPEDPTLMIGDEEKLTLLARAYAYLSSGYASRDVARWLGHVSGQPYDHAGLYRAHRRWKQAQETKASAKLKAPTLSDLIGMEAR